MGLTMYTNKLLSKVKVIPVFLTKPSAPLIKTIALVFLNLDSYTYINYIMHIQFSVYYSIHVIFITRKYLSSSESGFLTFF